MGERVPKQGVCVVGCNSSNLTSIVSSLIGGPVPEGNDALWKISNKYYDAEVHVDVVADIGVDGEDNKCVQDAQALLVVVDTDEKDFFRRCKLWWDGVYTKEKLEVRLLLLQHDDMVGGSDVEFVDDVMEWCIQEGFECVEEAPTKASVGADDDGYVTAFGMDRVQEALQVCNWPNMHMKGGTRTTSSTNPVHPSAVEQQLTEEELDQKFEAMFHYMMTDLKIGDAERGDDAPSFVKLLEEARGACFMVSF